MWESVQGAIPATNIYPQGLLQLHSFDKFLYSFLGTFGQESSLTLPNTYQSLFYSIIFGLYIHNLLLSDHLTSKLGFVVVFLTCRVSKIASAQRYDYIFKHVMMEQHLEYPPMFDNYGSQPIYMYIRSDMHHNCQTLACQFPSISMGASQVEGVIHHRHRRVVAVGQLSKQRGEGSPS